MLRQVKNSLGLLVLQLRVLGTTQRALDLTREILCDQTHVRDPARVMQDKGISEGPEAREEIFAWGSGLAAAVTTDDAADQKVVSVLPKLLIT